MGAPGLRRLHAIDRRNSILWRLWVALARRLKPGDRCWRWDFWAGWWEERIVAEQEPKLSGVRFRNDAVGGTWSDEWRRIRPTWMGPLLWPKRPKDLKVHGSA